MGSAQLASATRGLHCAASPSAWAGEESSLNEDDCQDWCQDKERSCDVTPADRFPHLCATRISDSIAALTQQLKCEVDDCHRLQAAQVVGTFYELHRELLHERPRH